MCECVYQNKRSHTQSNTTGRVSPTEGTDGKSQEAAGSNPAAVDYIHHMGRVAQWKRACFRFGMSITPTFLRVTTPHAPAICPQKLIATCTTCLVHRRLWERIYNPPSAAHSTPDTYATRLSSCPTLSSRTPPTLMMGLRHRSSKPSLPETLRPARRRFT